MLAFLGKWSMAYEVDFHTLAANLVGKDIEKGRYLELGALLYCQHNNPGNATTGTNNCDVASYLFSLQRFVRGMADGEPSSQPFDDVPDGSSYASIFTDYIAASKLVRLAPSSEPASLGASGIDALRKCILSVPPGPAISALSTLKGAALGDLCPPILPSLVVPQVVSNDYLLRLTDSVLLTGHADDTPTPSKFTRPPAVLVVGIGSGDRLSHACDVGMSALLEVVEGEIDVAAFVAASLTPVFGESPSALHRLAYTTPGNGAFEGVITAARAGDKLFVPFSRIIALRPSRGTKTATVIKYCFADAASITLVKELTALEAWVVPSSRELASSVGSLHLDTRMERAPPQPGRTWSSHALWPRPKANDGGDGESGEGGKNKRVRKSQKGWQADTKWRWKIVALTLPALLPPTVTRYGRRNATLSWLSGFKPHVGDTTDFGYNVTWYRGHDSHKPDGGVDLNHGELLKRGGGGAAFDDYHTHELQHELADGSLQPDTEYTFRVRLYYGEASGPPSLPSLAVRTPPRSAPARMHTAPTLLHAGDVDVTAEGASALTTSLTLTSPPPLDDGGSPVVGFIVETRHIDPHHHSDWVPFGSVPVISLKSGGISVTVDHLVPGCAYEFRLTAYNHVGLAEAPGTPSLPLHTGRHVGGAAEDLGRKGTLVVPGHGARLTFSHHMGDDHAQDHHENGPAVRAHLKSLHDPHVFASHGPVVTLDDEAQTITFTGKAGEAVTVEVWSSHFSPKTWRATAELIVADPPLADAPLSNGRAVRQRIVLVERGGCALVDKALRAQAAGALAVVVSAGSECTAFDQFCSPGADKSHGDGFAKLDLPHPWWKVKIPVVIMLQSDTDTVLELF